MERKAAIRALKNHLQCMDEQERENANSCALFFENTSVCCRSPFYSCRSSRCALIQFVPEKHLSDLAPCRHIQLNAEGETLHGLFNLTNVRHTERTVREWLMATIGRLEREAVDKVSKVA
jgi:hypothetical protein